MTARIFLKTVVCWPTFFLCLLFVGSAEVSLSDQPAGGTYSADMEIALDKTDLSGSPFFGLSETWPKEVGGLASANSSRPAPPSVSGEVTASWYGPGHHNKLTASGQRFDMHKNTLAHRTLPLGTKVRFVNPDNGKSAEGVVNDRGPYIKGRDVDVSYAMAKQLGFIKKGVTKLDIETM